MKFHNDGADCFIPDSVSINAALARTTHVGIGAHQDDLEIMAFHGIASCFHSRQRWFAGLTCTNGAGSLRAGAYRNYAADALQRVRRSEQRSAASIGRYSAMVQLDYSSGAIRSGFHQPLVNDLRQFLLAAVPAVVYTHSLADRHTTHVAVALHVIRALRELPETQQPHCVYGCEIWGSLDWLSDNDKVVLDVSGQEHLASALIGLYDSQIDTAKRYDLATLGRRRSNAAYLQSHSEARAEQVIFAMDLKPLVVARQFDPVKYVSQLFDRARDGISTKLTHQLRSAHQFSGDPG
ncbi:MAG: PIG-L family deacetylase [Gammaproteobacteria bacterium]|jgi:LmbE family N-acetylglucosaminyl deacetylase